MDWESLNEYIEESFRARFKAGNGFKELNDDKIDKLCIDSYIKYLDEYYLNREKQRCPG